MSDTALPPETPFPLPRDGHPMDPPPAYAEIRTEGRARRVTLWNGQKAWIFTRLKDVKAVLVSRKFSADPTTPGYPFVSEGRAGQLSAYNSFVTMDPPEHTRLRRMLAPEFSQARIETFRPLIEQKVGELLDAMAARGGSAELFHDFALALPTHLISEMLGVPQEDQDELGEWSRQRFDPTLTPDEIRAAASNMFERLVAIIEEKTRIGADGDHILDRLIHDYITPGELSVAEAANMGSLLYFGGHHTTAASTTLGVLSLLMHPEQKGALLADPSLIAGAVEEILRHDTISQFNSARAATDDVTIGDVEVKAGEGVFALVTAANRDPEAFPDPDRFDIRRAAPPHVGFAFGIHKCIGEALARVEMEVAILRLFQRFPTLRLAVPFEALTFKRESSAYGVDALPVEW